MKTKIFIAIALIFALSGALFADKDHDLELARRFLAIEEYEKAIEPLERLYKQYPDDPEVQQLLREAYLGAKKYDKLSALLESMLLANPDDPRLWVDLGGVYLSQNQIDKAMDAFDHAVKLAPKNVAITLQIHTLLQQWSFIDEDIKFLKSARRRLGDKTLFALELARLYEIKGDFKNVVREYRLYLKAHPDRFSEVEHRIAISDRTPEELVQLRDELKSLFDTDVPKWQPWRLISLIDQKLGDYSAALDALIKAENFRDDRRRGALMAGFVKDMLAAGRYDIAEKGARYLIEHAGRNYALSGKLYLAYAYRAQGNFDLALAQLDSLLGSNPAPSLAENAAILMADILLENLHNPDSAQRVVDNFVEKSPRASRDEDFYFVRGKILIYRREFEKAKKFLREATAAFQESQKLAYLLGMTYFFAGSYDTANIALHNIVAHFPKSRWGNEGVELLLIMQVAGENVDKLREPLFLMFIHDTTGALKLWHKLAGDKSLADVGDYILWKSALCQLTLGDPDATATLEQLVEKYPESFYAPLAYEKLADMQLAAGNPARAVEIYTKIVNDYPDAVNLESVRDKLAKFGNF